MKHQLNEKWDTFDVFCLMESLARDVSLDGEMSLYDEEFDTWQDVSLGLEPGMYAVTCAVTSDSSFAVVYPDGKSIQYLRRYPGVLESKGNQAFENAVEARIHAYVPAALGKKPIMFAETRALRSLPADERMRRFYRAAASAGASMHLTDGDRHGKLVRITATWMLDVYEKPIDIVIRFKNGGWFLYHNETGIGYASNERFTEAKGLLKILLN